MHLTNVPKQKTNCRQQKKKKNVLTVFYCVLSHNLPFFSSSKRRRYEGTFEQNRHPGTAMSLSPVETITFLLLYLTITGVA